MICKRSELLVLVWTLLVGGAGAETVYVSPGGSDASPGTKERPLQTPRGAAALLGKRPDITEIVIRGGTYTGGMALAKPTDADPEKIPTLTIRAAEGERVIFDGAMKIERAEPVEGCPDVFRVPGNFSYHRLPHVWELDTRTRYALVADVKTVAAAPGTFTFDEKAVTFRTTDGKEPKAHQMGISNGTFGIFPRRPNTVIEGIEFHSFVNWRWASGIDFRAENVVVRNCRAWNCYRGFLVSHEAVNCRIENCRADDCGGGVYASGTNTQVLDGQYFKIRDAFMVPTYPQDDTGIQYYSPSKDGRVRGNLVKGFRNAIFLKTGGIYTVEHNTVIDGEWGLYRSGWGPGNRYLRNVIVGFSQPLLGAVHIQPGCEVDYNCIWRPTERDHFQDAMEGPARVGTGKHNFHMDPRFAAPQAGDYRLLPDSPCVALGGERPIGAFGIVGRDFKDTQPPSVELRVRSPAVRAGASGEMFFEKDLWLGGGTTSVKTLQRSDPDADYGTAKPKLDLDILAHDAAGRLDKMRVRIDDGEWSEDEPFASRKTLELPEQDGVHRVAVRVVDDAGNWAEPVTLRVRLNRQAPEVVGEPAVYASSRGVVISFRTAQPAFAKVEFGPDGSCGTIQEEAQYVHRRWESNDGGDWVSRWQEPRTQHHIALLCPTVKSEQTYRYRILVRDAAGNEGASKEFAFKVAGSPKTLHVNRSGKDEVGRGSEAAPFASIQFAVDRALPGDRVVVAPGLYMDEAYLSHGGAEGAPITVEAAKPGTVILDGVRKAGSLFRLENAPHVTIKDFEIRWYHGSGNGIYVADSPNCSVIGCKIWNHFWSGWPEGYGVFAHRSPGLVAERNLWLRQESGLYLLSSPGARITQNTGCRQMYAAVHVIDSAKGTVMRNNSFCFNGNDQYVIYGIGGADLSTFDCDYNNLGTKLRAKPEGEELLEPKDRRLFSGSKAIISCDGQRFHTLKAWQEFSGKDKHSIFADPLYVGAVAHDYRLDPESPNLSAGEKGATIGAFGAREP